MPTESLRPGRSCPLSYRYGAQSLARPAEIEAETLFVAGGLYGNPFALEALLRMVEAEPAAQLIFNGDFNWFNIDDAGFERINREVLAHHAIRGNVETELLAADAAAGCGCGYPDYVADADVARSNAIMGMLAGTARRHPALAARLVALPMTMVARVAGVRVGILHGDADSLAGWSFGEEAIDAAQVVRMFERARVRVFASSHTCLPVAQVFATAAGPSALINNGAAGMANFAATRFGVVTRISSRPAPPATGALYSTMVEGAHIDALPLHFDDRAWLLHFDQLWPAASPAAISYRGRIADGPSFSLRQAMRSGIHCGAGGLARATR